MGARIRLINDGEGGLLARIAFRQSRRRYGQVIDPIRVMAHHPKVMAGVGALELASQRSKLVPARLKHLAELRAGMIAGCEWCLDFGSAISAETGVSEDDLRELAGYECSDRFSELEKLVLDYATGMSGSPVQVPEDLFRQLTPHLGEAQLVELTNTLPSRTTGPDSTGRSVWKARGSLRAPIAFALSMPASETRLKRSSNERRRGGACLRSS